MKTLFGTLVLLTSTSFAATPVTPSSEIPARREFPLNTAVNPCEDFHKHVCSTVEASFKLREDRSVHGFAFSDSRERLLEDRKKFMLALPQRKDLNARGKQIQAMYMACMDTKARAQEEKEEVAAITKQLNMIDTPEQWMRYSNQNVALGQFGPLIGFSSINSMEDPKKQDLYMGLSLMELEDHKYYENAQLLKDYKKLWILFLKTIDPQLTDKKAQARADAIIQLEKDFIKTYPVANVRRQRWSEKRLQSQESLIKQYPNLQLEILTNYAPKKTVVAIPIPETLEFLNKELKNRPLEVWKDIYLWNALSSVMDEAYPQFFQAQFDFQKKYFGGPAKRSELQERCTRIAGGYFAKELDTIQIDELFPNFDEKKVEEVGKSIRNSILAGLKENTWLSPEAKKGAIEKVEKARLQLVKPHNEREWDYNPVREYSATGFIKNRKTFNAALFDKNRKELTEPSNLDAWGMSPLTVNAYYSPTENKFVLPVGILQYPFYDKGGSLLENLGAVGAVIGHELGHGIDDQGSKYDASGKLNQWMPTKDVMEFNLRGQKLVQQFEKAEHDGKLTLGENVADLVGLTFAYNAAFPKGEGSATDKQKFFVSYARLWCQVARPEYEALARKTDPHSSGRARINEQVKQQPGFAEAFSCKVGDKMVLPEDQRVKIW